MQHQFRLMNFKGQFYHFFDWNEGDERERTVYMRMTDDAYPAINNSSFNVYYEYTYFHDREELNKKVDEGDYEVLPATPW